MQDELASCPGPGFQEPAELLCASEIVDDSCMYVREWKGGRLYRFRNADRMRYGLPLLCVTVLVFGRDTLFPGRSFAPTLFCAKN